MVAFFVLGTNMKFSNYKVCHFCDELAKSQQGQINSAWVCTSCSEEKCKGAAHDASGNWRGLVYICSGMIGRAKERGKYEVNLTHHNVLDIWPRDGMCPILGIRLERNHKSRAGSQNSPNLDRIDSSKGYIVGNIQIISGLANRMKQDANPEQMVKFAEWVIDNC